MSLPKLALAGGLLAVTALALKPANMRKSSEAGTETPPRLPTSPEDVAAEARALDHFVIEAAQTAREKAQGEELKEWVETLLADHRRSLAALDSLILNEAYWMPVDDILPPYADWLDALRMVSLQDFDRTFLQRMADVHQGTRDIFTAYTTRHPRGALAEHLAAGAEARDAHLQKVDALKALPDPVIDFSK